jgi:hypothetical protein
MVTLRSFAVAPVLALALSLGACNQKEAVVVAEPPPPYNFRGMLKLTKDERDTHTKSCMQVALNLKTPAVKGSPAGQTVSQNSVCDCIIDQLQDRSSKLQFMMLMTLMKDHKVVVQTTADRRPMPTVQQLAVKNGVAAASYDSDFAELPAIGRAAVSYCKKRAI